jgi:hypothetical protein
MVVVLEDPRHPGVRVVHPEDGPSHGGLETVPVGKACPMDGSDDAATLMPLEYGAEMRSMPTRLFDCMQVPSGGGEGQSPIGSGRAMCAHGYPAWM